MKLADSVLGDLWRNGLECLLHLLMPRCLIPEDERIDHLHPALDGIELQDAFEKIDFSALIFREGPNNIFRLLFDLFEWLAGAVRLILLLREVCV